MRPLYVTNSVVATQGGYHIVTFENNGQMTTVKLSQAQAQILLVRLGKAVERNSQ